MIGVIADDLTGAAELGAVGLRHGLRAEVVLDAQASSDADLISIDTDSRSCSPAEARRRAGLAAGALVASGAARTYKKVDSVLRGHVVAEIGTIMNRLALPRALLVPANPTLGRVVRDGHYFVGGKPIHETEFRFDPEHPRRESSVLSLLGTENTLPIQVCKADGVLPDAGIIVGEADDSQTLRQWAGRCDDSMLASGAAEFFSALLDLAWSSFIQKRKIPDEPRQLFPELFVSGTASESSREFLAESRRRGVPVFCLPEELAREGELPPVERDRLAAQVIAALESSPRVILAIGLPHAKDSSVSKHLTNHLIGIAGAVLSRRRVGHVFVEGGATAAELVRRLGWGRLKVVREIQLGVVTLAPTGAEQCLLTMKPGSYVWPESVRG